MKDDLVHTNYGTQTPQPFFFFFFSFEIFAGYTVCVVTAQQCRGYLTREGQNDRRLLVQVAPYRLLYPDS